MWQDFIADPYGITFSAMINDKELVTWLAIIAGISPEAGDEALSVGGRLCAKEALQRLYRAVNPAELKDIIENAMKYRVPFGTSKGRISI